MPFGLRLITGPAVEPVVIDAPFRARLRLDGTDDDGDVEAMVAEARELVERETHRALITQTWELVLDEFPYGCDEIRVPRPPLQSVTSIKYYDADGVLTTLSSSNYHVATAGEPGRIWPVDGYVWPTTQAGRPEAVVIRFVCGWTPTTVPRSAVGAVKALVTHWYMHRGDDDQTAIPPRVRRVLNTLEFGEQW